MSKVCDHTSVGIVIRDSEGRFALLKRAKFPIGIAPVAGHIDDHGSPERAAKDEVSEELGLTVLDLAKTNVYDRRVDNKCRRAGGDYHNWYLFTVTVDDTKLYPSEDETKGAAWYDLGQLQALADRTKSYRIGEVSEADWSDSPGLEEVWAHFLHELGYISA
jgi:8-oxo-dGTP pyrophosphatase MutT (NUDIX family)